MWICTEIIVKKMGLYCLNYTLTDDARLFLFNINTKENIEILSKDIEKYNILGIDKDTFILHRMSYQDYLISTCIEFESSEQLMLSPYDDISDFTYFCTFNNGLYGKHPFPTVMSYIRHLFNIGVDIFCDDNLVVNSLVNTQVMSSYTYRILDRITLSKVLTMG